MRAPERPGPLHEGLLASARQRPDAPAIVGADKVTTFGQLRESAASLAAVFCSRGLERGERVALLMPKSAEALTSVFASLLAGAIYVPMPPRWPAQRTAAALEECAPRFVIRQAGGAPPSITDRSTGEQVCWEEATRGGGDFRGRGAAPDDPAVILFTSGSTGQPKGVTLSHRAVGAFVSWSAEEFQLGCEDRIACPAPLGFDLSTFDVFGMAWRGAACVLVPEDIVWMPRFLTQFLSEQRISVWYSVPSILTGMLNEGGFAQRTYPHLRLVLFAGEVFAARHLARLQSLLPQAAFCNLYGPTEANVVTWHRVPEGFEPGGRLPIGKACPYAEVVLNPATWEAAEGAESGELLVAGESLMSGYWNRPEETARAFVELDGKRYYRTGDRVSRSSDGNYLFMGRTDRQVKRRGFRIELGEIEEAIRSHPEVLEAGVVSVDAEDSGTCIMAFVRPCQGVPLTPVEIKTHCARFLPAYTLPDHIVFLEAMPTGGRGKVDYQALRRMAESRRRFMDIKAAIREYIIENHLRGEEGERLGDSTPLLSSGIIDSIGVLGLVSFLESRFGIEFMPRELDLDRLENLDQIERAVRRKLETGGGQ